MRCWGCGRRRRRRRRRNCGGRGPHDRGGDGGARAALGSGRQSCGDGGYQGPTDRACSGRQAAALSSGGRCCDSVGPPAVAAVGSAPASPEEGHSGSSSVCNKNKVANVEENATESITGYSLVTIRRSNETVVVVCGELWSTDKITVCGYFYRNNANQSQWQLVSRTTGHHYKLDLDEKMNPEVEDNLTGVAGEFVESIDLDEKKNPEVEDNLTGVAREFVESVELMESTEEESATGSKQDDEEHSSKKDDEQDRSEEYKRLINLKAALRQNANDMRTLDSSIKRNTSIIKKLKMINDEVKDGLIEELKTVNLSKFVSEAVSYICTAKLRSTNIQAAVEICSLLHQRYMDFSPCLIQGLLETFYPGKSGEPDLDKNARAMKKRSTLKLLMELYFVGVFEDVTTFTNIIKDLTSLEHLKDRETTQTNLSLLACFARQGKFFLGLQQDEQDAYDEFFMGLNITSDQKSYFKKAFCSYYDAANELLLSEHASLCVMESENAKILNAKGELSDENTASYEKLRRSFDQLLHCVSSLAEALDMQPPVMPEDGRTTRVTTGIDLTPSEKESAVVQHIWDDEDTKAFYESLPDLRAFVPAVLLGEGEPKLAEQHGKDNKQSNIDIDEKMNPEVEDNLTGVSGEFVKSAAMSMCSSANNSKSKNLEDEDLLPHAEKGHGINLQGFSEDENKPCKKQIDLDEKMDPKVTEILIGVAGGFVESAAMSMCSSANNSKSKNLEDEDLLPHAEKGQNINLPGFSGDEDRPCKKQLQFTVKAWNGTSISVQKDIDSTKVRSLVESTCEKLGIHSLDGYAILEGKPLENDEYLSHYSISQDSNIEIRVRLRAGQYTTFDDQFNIAEDVMFDKVPLPQILRQLGVAVQTTSVKFFSYLSTCYLHEILKCVTWIHRDGWSFNGAFDSKDILFIDGRVHINSTEEQVPFDEFSCAKDYSRLHDILKNKFLQYGYPIYFSYLLDYLRTCPAKGLSNTEAVIGFVTNHPCLEPYMDRMKQVMILDNIIPRLGATQLQALTAALGHYPDWADDHVHGVPEMDRIYYFKNKVDAAGTVSVNPLYTDTPRGCIHYSNNYMKHTINQVDTETLEAAYSLHFEDFFAEMLLKLALHFHHDKLVIALLSNRLADKRRKDRSN